MRMGGRGLPELQLVKESRFGSLWGERRSHEASGVHLRDGHLHVVFDDTPSILRLGLVGRLRFRLPGGARDSPDTPERVPMSQ